MTPRLVLFTRFPEPGKAKTRLMPALGSDGAAALHRRLTERTLATMLRSGLPVELRVTGAPAAAFRDWLGTDLAVIDQGDGDLGAKLTRSSADAPVILLGADTPGLRAEHLVAAAEALSHSQAVLGPATDGGYWLLGLARPMPDLFVDMPWSTSAVCAKTLARLAEAGIAPILLETLDDCDRPEDLARWPELVA